MWLYLKPNRRRPVRFDVTPLTGDVQGSIPVYWCGCCGAEVFTFGQTLCKRCKKEGEDIWEQSTAVPALVWAVTG